MNKRWKRLLTEGRVKPQTSSLAEIEALRGVVARDLADANIESLSTDRRFATAYNAALQMARMVIACSGHRLTSDAGHHAVAFEAAGHLLGDAAVHLIDYFDVCRRKRNQIDYLHAAVASDTEAAELVEKAEEFRDIVETWIASVHPELT